MARPKEHGVKQVVRKRAADGTILKADYYLPQPDSERPGKTKLHHLGSDFEKAKLIAAEMQGEVKAPLPITVFDGLVADYFGSSKFTELAPSSQALNRLYIDKLLAPQRFGGAMVEDIDGPALFAFEEALKREIAKAPKREPGEKKPRLLKGQEGPMTPDKAWHMMNKLVLMLSHAVRTGVISENPAKEMEKSGFGVEARDCVWTDEQIEAFLKQAPPKLKVAAALLFYTAQRLSDVLSMDWGKVSERDGRLWVKLRQQKTDALIEVPAHRELAAILRPLQKEEGLLVTSPRSKAMWQRRNFARAWDVAMEKAGLSGAGLQRRDLRRTAMCKMAEGGATDVQIAGVSGHSIEKTRQILATYIPRLGKIAAAAIAAWESLDGIAESEDVQKLATAGEQILGARDRAHALKMAKAGVPTESIAEVFGWTLDEAARLLGGIAGAPT